MGLLAASYRLYSSSWWSGCWSVGADCDALLVASLFVTRLAPSFRDRKLDQPVPVSRVQALDQIRRSESSRKSGQRRSRSVRIGESGTIIPVKTLSFFQKAGPRHCDRGGRRRSE